MVEKKWKRLKRKTLLKTRIVTVYQDKVLLPNGAMMNDYTIVEKPDYVKVVAIDRRGSVLMQREYRHAVGRYMWELPGGFMEKGESPIESARRELLEETGYAKGKFKFVGTISDYGSTDTHTGYVVRVTDVSGRGKQHLETTESITGVTFFPVAKVRKMILNGEIENTSLISSLVLAGFFF